MNMQTDTEYTDSFENHGDADDTNALDNLVKRAFILTGALILILILLGAVLKIEGAVIGTGDVSVESRVKEISHPSGGVLSELLVRDGQKVAKGDTILRFDTTVSEPAARFSGMALQQLIARRGRLIAERDNASRMTIGNQGLSENDRPTSDVISREQQAFSLNRSERQNQKKLLNDRIRQSQQLINSYKAQIDAAQQQLKLIEPELDGLRSLWERKLVPISRLNQLERQAVELKGREASLQANIAQSRASISELRGQILAVDQNARAQAATELAQVEQVITDQRIRSTQASDSFSRSIVKAPQTGIIDGIRFSTTGSLIPAGEIIARIVPNKDQLIIEGRISPADIDQVNVDQNARVMLSALNLEQTPELIGKVDFVSAERADDPNSGQSYYRVRIILDKNSDPNNYAAKLKAGMPVDIFLETGSRSILSYMLKPLFDHISRAFRS